MSTLNLEKLAEKEIDLHLTTRSMLFLEAAIASLLDTRNPHQVAKILRNQANDLEAFG